MYSEQFTVCKVCSAARKLEQQPVNGQFLSQTALSNGARPCCARDDTQWFCGLPPTPNLYKNSSSELHRHSATEDIVRGVIRNQPSYLSQLSYASKVRRARGRDSRLSRSLRIACSWPSGSQGTWRRLRGAVHDAGVCAAGSLSSHLHCQPRLQGHPMMPAAMHRSSRSLTNTLAGNLLPPERTVYTP